MQGQAFMGPFTTPEPEFVFGFRGRMDERYDLTRSVRDHRYVYLRNYMPHRPYGQHVAYLFQTPTTAVWKRMYDNGELKPPQTAFWEPKPSEELYDLEEDRFETRNLAGSTAHREVLARLRGALDAHERATRDVGFLPEYEFHRDRTSTVFEWRRDQARYDFDSVYAAARAATDRSVAFASVRPGLSDANPVVRYWAAIGALVRGAEAVSTAVGDLEKLLDDSEPGPRIVAAEALGRFGPPAFRERAIALLVQAANPASWPRLNETAAASAAQLALYTLNQLTGLSDSVKAQVAALPPAATGARGRGAVASGAPQPSRGDYRAGLKAAIAADVR
jgi:uncharacterized sulfatase